ncbi:MAG: DUF5915 domain-containing protein, partial [SAR324 cluster bacterium]|nr:DUF5915 domain-containing protein [SAR324 cluster bacterium]
LFEKPAFKACVVSGMLLAEDGKKMSKSLKNYPDPWDMLNKYGADVVRLYMLNSGAIRADELKFAESGLQETIRGIFIPLWNVLSFFTTYAEIDNWQPPEVAPKLENPLDQWIMSRLHHLAFEVETQMEQFDLNKSVAPFVGFIDMLTNWYVRRSRRRFWKSGDGDDKTAAYHTLYTVLFELSKITAPFIPFLSEAIYQILKTASESTTAPDSVHLCLFPTADEAFINKDLEEEMDLVLKAVNMGRAIRARQQLKIRQPLASVTLVTKNKAAQGVLEVMADLITDELNVKEVKISHNEEELVHLSAKPNLKLLGPKLGKKLGKIKPMIEAFTSAQIVAIQNGGSETLELEGESFEIGLEELFLERSEREGIITMSEGDLTLAIDAHLTQALLDEGLAREFVNKVQQTRKDKDLDVSDRIHVEVFAAAKVTDVLKAAQAYIAKETLCDKISFETEEGDDFTTWDLNGQACSFRLFIAV